MTRENSYKLELMVLQRVETLSEVEQTRFSKLIGNFIQDSSLGFFGKFIRCNVQFLEINLFFSNAQRGGVC